MTNTFTSELIDVAARCHVIPNIIMAILEGEATIAPAIGGWAVTAPAGETGTLSSGELADVLQWVKTSERILTTAEAVAFVQTAATNNERTQNNE
ncbi:MAG: hypothetical protein ACRC46_10945 [Thermoguttaceae bacterium]